MLLPYLPILNSKKIILGSQSISRNLLCESQKLKYERVSSKFAEDLEKESFQTPEDYNLETCRGKVADLLQTFNQTNREWDLLICGDTIVCDEGKIIEKPVDEKDCVEMMGALANKTHQSYTAHIIVLNTTPQIKCEWVIRANVTFGNIPLESLKEFAKTPEPYIHSGGYELAGISGSLIKEINGSHTSVQGLDLHSLSQNIIKCAREAKWIE